MWCPLVKAEEIELDHNSFLFMQIIQNYTEVQKIMEWVQDLMTVAVTQPGEGQLLQMRSC